MGSFELVEFYHLRQEFHRPDQPARESLYHGAYSPDLPLPTATWDKNGFLLPKQPQCHYNSVQHLSLSRGYEKLDGDFSLGPESKIDSYKTAYAHGNDELKSTMGMPA